MTPLPPIKNYRHDHDMDRRQLLTVAAGAGLWAVGLCARAQSDFPTQAIKIVVPYSAGTGSDALARTVAQGITDKTGKVVVVENRDGGGSLIGTMAVAKAVPDGHTLLIAANPMVIVPAGQSQPQYNPTRDFVPVAKVGVIPLVLATTKSLGFKTLGDLIAYAKANPGKLSVATNGEGGYPHLTFEDLRLKAGFSYLHVPYKGSVQVTNDVLSGQVQAGILGMAPFAPHIRAGKMRLIAISPPYKVPDWPEATLAQDVVPGFSALGWFGYVAPAGTPPDVVEKLNKGINAAIAQPAVTEKLQNLGLVVVNESPQYFDKVLRADFERYGQIVKAIGYQPQ